LTSRLRKTSRIVRPAETARAYFTTSVRFTLDVAPFGAVAVTTSGYDPGGVADPLGDFATLLHADISTAKIISNPNETAQRGCLL
jgi:hypothetical protein